MPDESLPRARYGEAFRQAHHEAWKRSDHNQREYCEVQVLSLKGFGNWRAKFKAEAEAPLRKLHYRRGGVNHTSSHVTYLSLEAPQAPVVPPLRGGHRRRFSDAQRTHALAETAQPGATVSEVARCYSIDRRVPCRWRQEERIQFVDVEIVDAASVNEEVAS